MSTPTPPLIPSSANFATIEVSTAKIFEIIGDSLNQLGNLKGVALAASTGDLTLLGGQSVDGVALVSGDLVLVKNQTDGSENGLYTVSTTAWTRTDNMEDGTSASGAVVFVSGGTLYTNTTWICTNVVGSDVIGTDDLVFVMPTTTIIPKETTTIANFAAAAATVNANAGTITVSDATLGIATRSTVIVVTNSSVTTTSVVSVTCVNPVASTGEPYAVVTAVGAGTFDMYVYTPITAIGATALDISFSIL